MSKKNRNKNKAQEDKATSGSAFATNKPKDEKDQDLKREFKHLAATISFILLLLAALYYFDQKDHILDGLTSWIFGLF